MAGGKIDILVEPDMKGFTGKLDKGLRGSVGKIAGLGASVAAAMGGAALAADIGKMGLEVDRLANRIGAVTQATSEQMQAVEEHAKALGKATDLTGTSSADAMEAMLELAKGGFKVEQAMGAAKGTLQLASAASLDAGQAAEITGQQINTFGLQAEDAARVADVLAGAANSAAGDIPTMAQGLQQAGNMANMFGISLEDTVTTLGLFANNGVLGSDAGTMMKTMLTQLVNPSKQAKAAMDELGLVAHDSAGEFVGMRSVLLQLHDAYGRMTQEDFGRNAATIFGTDAVRAAGIAAKATAEDWDALSESITRQGNAADLAAANTRGLPGVVERLENTMDDVKLSIYDEISPMLVELGTSAAAAIDAAGPSLVALAAGAVSTADALGEAMKTVTRLGGDAVDIIAPLAGAMGDAAGKAVDLAGGLDKIAGPAAGLGVAYLVSRYTGLTTALHSGYVGVRNFNDAIRLQKTLAGYAGESISTVAAAWGEVERRSPAIRTASQHYRAGSSHLKGWALQSKRAAENTTGLSRALRLGGSHAARFGDTLVGVGKAGGSLAKSGMGGLVSLLGGPWVLAATAAVGITLAVVDTFSRYKHMQEELAKTSRITKDAQDNLSEAIARTGGAMTGQALTAAKDLVKAHNHAFESVGKSGNIVTKLYDWTNTDKGFDVLWGTAMSRQNAIRDAFATLGKEASKLGYELDDVYGVVASGGKDFDTLKDRLEGAGDSGKIAAAQLQILRNKTTAYIDAARAADPAYQQIKDSIETLADSAASAQDKVAAMNTLFEEMGLIEVSAGDALNRVEEHIDNIADSAASLSEQGPLGDALWKENGDVERDLATARALHDDIIQVGRDYQNALLSGIDPSEAVGNYKRGLETIAGVYQTNIDQVQAYADKMVGTQEMIERAARLDGAGELEKSLADVAAEMERIGDEPLSIQTPEPEVVAAFEALGVSIRDIGNGHIEIDPVSPETMQSVHDMESTLSRLRDEEGIDVEAHIGTDTLHLDADEVKKVLADLDTENASPAAKLLLDELYEGTDLTKTELLYLTGLSADPKATLETIEFRGEAGEVRDELASIHRSKTEPTVDANTAPAMGKLSQLWGALKKVGSAFVANLSATAGVGMKADGAFTPAASGFLSQQQATMARGGDWIVWAEDETQGESFIPHAASKRRRSTEILRQTAELFGMSLVDRAGRPVGSSGVSTAAPASRRFADGGLRSSLIAGKSANIAGLSIKLDDVVDILSEHIAAVRTIQQTERELADMRETFAREVDDVKDAEKALEDARERERDALAKISDAEDRAANARDKSATSGNTAAGAEDRVSSARNRAGDASDAVADAEQKLADARAKVATQADRAAKANAAYIAGQITAAGQAVQQVFSAAASIASLVAEGYKTQADYFRGLEAVADSVERLKVTVTELRMGQARLRMQTMAHLQSLQSAEIAVARSRMEGIGSVAEAEANLAAVREKQRLAGLTSIEAMTGALDRFRTTGVFSVESVTVAMEGASAEERAAIAAVAIAKANAAIADLQAQRERELAALEYQTAIFNQQASVMELRITTDALRQQAKLLGGMTAGQARGAAAALDGKARQSDGSSKIMEGVGSTLGAGATGAAAGFAVGGPIGALIGGIGGLLFGGLSSTGKFREGHRDIVAGKHQEKVNRKDLEKALQSMTPAERKRYLQDGSLVGGENLRHILEREQRSMEERLAAHRREVEAKRIALESKRTGTDSNYNAELAKLQSELDFYKAQQKIATARTPEELAAYREMAEIAGQMRDASIDMAASMRAESQEQIQYLRRLVDAAERDAKNHGVQTRHIEFALPPGEAFTREQTKAMMKQLAEAADTRLTELERGQQPTGSDYILNRI